MNLHKLLLTCLLGSAALGTCWSDITDWMLLDDFQAYNPEDHFDGPTEIGWTVYAPEATDEYWMLQDPYDSNNVAMYVDIADYVEGYGATLVMKALPNGGIEPGEAGTLFCRMLWTDRNNRWQFAISDKALAYDAATGLQTLPESSLDCNALIRFDSSTGAIIQRDGSRRVTTNPPKVPQVDVWYSFWMVVDNSWDMSTSPPTMTGTYKLYVQGEGFGDGESPTLIPVGTSPPKDSASLDRYIFDDKGDPRPVIWAVFLSWNRPSDSSRFDDAVMLDDVYFSPGENLTYPQVISEPEQLAAPSGLEAVILSGSEVQLTWQDNASSETGFRIYMKIGNDGTWQELADIPEENATSFPAQNLEIGQPLRFRVQAYSENYESRNSNIAIASWENPIFQDADLNRFDWWELAWFGQYTVVDRDWIHHDELGGLYVQGENASSIFMYSTLLESWLWTSEATFPRFYKYGPYAGWYYYYAGAANEDRWFARLSDGSYVRAPNINEAVPPPPSPSNLVANITSPNTVHLTWEDNAEYEEGYRIFMRTGDDEEWTEVESLQIKNLEYYLVEEVDTSIPLQFRVQAYTNGSESDFSNEAMAEVMIEDVDWIRMENFQAFNANEYFTEATDFGWSACTPDQPVVYHMLQDPYDPGDIALYVECPDYDGPYRSPTWVTKALPSGGIDPGETGTLFFRSLWTGYGHVWNMATTDLPLEFDDVTGRQTVPRRWGDLNAAISLGIRDRISPWGGFDDLMGVLKHEDGTSTVMTNPPQILQLNEWYNFWMVVNNAWDLSTTPATCTGIHTLYIQGAGIGDGKYPTLIPVGTDSPKDSASFIRAPVDDVGSPRAILHAVFRSQDSFGHPDAGAVFLLDDFYFSPGENLENPLLGDLPEQLALPTKLQATILPGTGIELTWEDHSSEETGYRIQIKIGKEGDWQELADISEANATRFLVEDLDPYQLYQFRVQAYSETLESEYSMVTGASWGNPVLQDATFIESGWWNLAWLGNYSELDKEWIAHDELGVLYVRGEDADSIYMYSTLLESWLWTSEAVFPRFYKYGPYAGWYYYYPGSETDDQWFARLADGTYVRAPHINEAVPQPAAPSNLDASVVSMDSVYLTWEDNADYEVGYRIFMMAEEDEEWTEVANLQTKDLTSHLLDGIDTSQPLRFRVQTYKYGSESEFSNIASAVAPAGLFDWQLIDDFQSFSDGDIFVEATDIGWNACAPDQTDEYWMLQDPFDPDNITLYVESGNYGVGYANTWVMKALPGGGIQPGKTGTVFFRCLWSGFDNNWHMATADKPLVFDEETGLQTAPGAWGDLNALIRLGSRVDLQHRDGSAYVATNPSQVPMFNAWYSFWMVVDNSWDMSTTPPTCTGTHTLYVQGEGFGDGISPVLIPVGTDPPKDSASLRRAPADDAGNPRAIIWAVFATNSGPPGTWGGGGPFLLDDFYFSRGENLTRPQ